MDHPLLEKLRDYTNLKSRVQAFFPALKNSFNINAYGRTYKLILIYQRLSDIGQ